MSGYTSATDLWTISMSWLIVLLLCLAVTVYGFRAYRKTGSRSMLALATGFAFLSVGTAGSWFGIYDASSSLFYAQFGCVGFLAAGFGMILYSLHTKFD
jgi:peptidoglycan/LPS O-acetylase OafA/YrhL